MIVAYLAAQCPSSNIWLKIGQGEHVGFWVGCSMYQQHVALDSGRLVAGCVAGLVSQCTSNTLPGQWTVYMLVWVGCWMCY